MSIKDIVVFNLLDLKKTNKCLSRIRGSIGNFKFTICLREIIVFIINNEYLNYATFDIILNMSKNVNNYRQLPKIYMIKYYDKCLCLFHFCNP